MTQELLLRETVYRNSPFFLDWLLLSWAATGQVQEEVEEFVSAMDARQQNLHLCLKGQFQDLLRIAERSYFFLQAGKHAYWRGDYSYAVACFFQGAERAAREGSLPVMMLCHLFLGNCYSTLNQLDQTLEHYEAARRMARSLGRRVTLVEIAYNQATTELQMGLTQEALRHLLEHPWNEALYFHKLAICYGAPGAGEAGPGGFGPGPGRRLWGICPAIRLRRGRFLSRCAASSGSGWTTRAISKSLSMEKRFTAA